MDRLGDDVRQALAAAGGGAALELTRVTEAWAQAVGKSIARNAWPLRLGRDGTLHVATSSATWAFELDRLGPDLAGRLQDVLGPSAPCRFRFRPGPVPEAGPSGESRREGAQEPAETPPEVARAAERLAAEIGDPELREMVARAARASLSRGRSGRAF